MSSVMEKRPAPIVVKETIDAQPAEATPSEMAPKSQSEAEHESSGTKKKEPILTPAPMPTKSPWKSLSSDVSVANITIESLEANKKKKSRPTASVSSGTKWVPIKASIVVSGSKRSGSGGKKNPSKANGNAKSNNTGFRKKKHQHQQDGQQGQRQPQHLKKQQHKVSGIRGRSNDNDGKIANDDDSTGSQGGVDESSSNDQRLQDGGASRPQDSQSLDSDNQESLHSSSFEKTSNFTQYNESLSHNQPQNRRNNQTDQNQHYPYPQNNSQRKKYYNNYNNNEAFQQPNFVPFQQQRNSFEPYHGRVPRSFKNGFHPRYHQIDASQMYQPYYSVQPMMLAINNIAKQIEYYFSAENLDRDNYLRSKLSKEGYAPLPLISKFYRIVNMSFGGDSNLIHAALKQIISNENATVEIAVGSIKGEEDFDDDLLLSQYFIRSKNWASLLPETFSTFVEIKEILTPESIHEIATNLPTQPMNAPIYDESFNPNGHKDVGEQKSSNAPSTSNFEDSQGNEAKQ